MLEKFVMSPTGLALDRFLTRWTGFSLTTTVFNRAHGIEPGPVLYLETVGRKSGEIWGVTLPYYTIDNKIMVVGSCGGAPQDPNWALNLRKTPQATIYIKRKPQSVRARFTSSDERTRYWEPLKKRIPPYVQYEKLTTREIPVIVLESV